MAGRSYDLTPKDVALVSTRYREIVTRIPVPESLDVLQDLHDYEPLSMSGQPPVIWDRAAGCCVYDAYGNKWLDWSSGVLVTNAGHGRTAIVEAIQRQAQHGLLHNYCFPSAIRAALARKLVEITPKKLAKAFLLTTGSEATECAIKLARTHGRAVGGDEKIGIVSFEHAFHGRTLGAQTAGGIPSLKAWIVKLDPTFIQVPFPDGFRCPDTSFDLFLNSIAEQGMGPENISGVMTETYQGGGASFAPPKYIQALAEWCEQHDVVLIMDEVQAAFGRCGKDFGFEHYGIVPDLACFGKGISSSLPISAVVGREDLMDQYAAGSMTSTHTGNPICVAAALASIELIEKENLAENAAAMGTILQQGLNALMEKYSDVIGAVHGKGLVAGVHMVQAGGIEPDPDLAFDIVRICMEKGLLMFSPVGYMGATVKIAPPLMIPQDAICEGLEVLEEAIGETQQRRA